jgi:hypothetical protein
MLAKAVVTTRPLPYTSGPLIEGLFSAEVLGLLASHQSQYLLQAKVLDFRVLVESGDIPPWLATTRYMNRTKNSRAEVFHNTNCMMYPCICCWVPNNREDNILLNWMLKGNPCYGIEDTLP